MAEVLFNDDDDADRFDMQEEETPLRKSLPSPSVTTVVVADSDATVMLGLVIAVEEPLGTSTPASCFTPAEVDAADTNWSSMSLWCTGSNFSPLLRECVASDLER